MLGLGGEHQKAWKQVPLMHVMIRKCILLYTKKERESD